MDVTLSSDVLDVDLYGAGDGNRHLAAASLVSGKVVLIDFSNLASIKNDGAGEKEDKGKPGGIRAGVSDSAGTDTASYQKAWTVKPGSKSCRATRFTQDGTELLSISKDKSTSRIDVETGQVVQRWEKCHDAALSCVLSISHELFATGDDDGAVKLWDPRVNAAGSSQSVQSYTHHADWVTDMIWRQDLKIMPKKRDTKGKLVASKQDAPTSRSRLITVSGDGHLSVLDPRAGKKGVEMSEDQEDELLSLASIKGGDKIVVGTALGPLSIWAPSKGLLDHVDRLAGHPASIDSIDVLDEDTILTGSSDGLVRIVQVYPHKLLGVAADHGGFPVERATHSDGWLASIGHENFVRLTNLQELLGSDEEGSDDDEGDVPDSSNSREDPPGDARSDTSSDTDSGDDRKRLKKQRKITKELQESTAPEPDEGFFNDL